MVRRVSLQHASFAWTGWSINGVDEHLLSHKVSLRFAAHYNIYNTDGKLMVSKWHDVITFICNRTCKLKHWWIYQEMLYHKNISPQYGQPSVCAFFGKAVFHPGSALQTLDEYITLLLTCCHLKMTMNRTSVFLPRKKNRECASLEGASDKSKPEEH